MSGRSTTVVVAFSVLLSMTVLSARTEPAATIDCHIRATSQGNTLRLEAMAKGEKAASGTYRFEVSKISSSGSSQNVQSGAFRLQPDRDELLTTVILDGSALGHYRARLTLDTAEFGSVSCALP
ncbi:MAG: hypothetical protein J0H40_24080 [Rhizobiales bacterium]|nr:hypothetical protein [Hyphomicrobiales bacterium]